MFFGKKLKELRLKHPKRGMRNFAMDIGMDVLEYSNMEKGYNPPPDDTMFLHNVIMGLGIPAQHEDWMDLMQLYREPFVMQLMSEGMVPSPLTHKSDGTPLTENEFRGLADHVNNIAKEHNKKAREFNGA